MIFHADGNSFYASCEQIFRPDLRGKPVAVLSNNDGIIIALNKEAKALGIKRGDPYFKVRDLCIMRHITIFSSNYTLYEDISRRITSIYMEFEGNITNYDVEENGNFVNKWYDSFFDYSNNIVITLENGESVEGYFSTTHMDYDEHGGYYSGQIVYVKNNHTVSIAANEIVSLKINGVELI